ncbi:hypothetical protein [Bacillus subtilis]|uniref:hypothetical protein n=1 Tax=Bacillus subtilis TaxID=1423 RepID=UPI002027A470|nr:hypothetical protein [Bacillus subtilis]
MNKLSGKAIPSIFQSVSFYGFTRKTRKKDRSFIFEMHKVMTRAYFKKHFFFVDIQNGEMVVAALLKHRDKPDIKLDRLYSSRGDNINQNGAKKFSKSFKEPA